MNNFASMALIGWIPVVVPLFAVMPIRRAVIVAYIAAWLFLPNGGFELPGLPDFTKVTATSMGVLLGGLLFDPGPLLSLRPSWRDIPMLVWCACPFASSMSNGLGAYDGASALVSTVVTYGLPYLIARAYLNNSNCIRDVAIGIIVGGLIYVPFCLWEIRMSPQLQEMLYGRGRFINAIRYGGYRPLVFMNDGLELGMWMAAAAMIACWLWTSGGVKKIAGWALGPLAAILLATAVLCKSTGAILQMVLGLVILWASRRFRSALPALALAALAPLYCGVRTLGLWDGRSAVALTKSSVDEDRAQSLEFRLDNEDMLIARAMQRPVFGWGGWGRARIHDENGEDVSVTDGLWIIALGNHGVVGLASQVAILTLPLLVLVARCPARRWKDPDAAPAAATAILLALYMIDNLSNAMFNPIYYLAAGAMLSPRAFDRDMADREFPGSGGSDDGPELSWRHAECLEGDALSGGGDWAGVACAWDRVVGDARDHGGLSDRDLATAHGRLGLSLAHLGRWSDAVEARGRALELLAELAVRDPADAATSQALAVEMNALAHLLSVAENVADRDPSRAVSLASQAVRMLPDVASFHNTLGAACLRVGDWSAAVSAIGRAIALGRGGGTRSDHLILAIASAHLGDWDAARASLREVDLRMPVPGSGPPEMEDLRIEIIESLHNSRSTR